MFSLIVFIFTWICCFAIKYITYGSWSIPVSLAFIIEQNITYFFFALCLLKLLVPPCLNLLHLPFFLRIGRIWNSGKVNCSLQYSLQAARYLELHLLSRNREFPVSFKICVRSLFVVSFRNLFF